MNPDNTLLMPSPATVVSELNFLYDEARKLYPEEHLQYLERDTIARCQALLGHGNQFGLWETPQVLTGRRQKANEEKVVLRRRLVSYLPTDLPCTAALETLLDEGELWMSRYALLLRLGPAAIQKHRDRSLDPSTIVKVLTQWLPQILVHGIRRRLEDAGSGESGLAYYLSTEDLRVLSANRHVRAELNRMTMLMARGLWSDAPVRIAIKETTNPKGNALVRPKEEKSNPYLPIPDGYLAKMGPRVLWLVLDLGPNISALSEALPKLISGLSLKSRAFPGRLQRYLAQNIWRDREGRPITQPPFRFRIGSHQAAHLREIVDEYEWPPRTWQQVQALMVALQSAHLWVAFLALAGRMQEVLTLPRDCIEWAGNGKPYMNGKTYKLSRSLVGEEREWPAPELLVDALAQQVRLARACERVAWVRDGSDEWDELRIEGDHLWASLGTGAAEPDKQLVEVNHTLKVLARRLGMPPRPGGRNLHTHRFRKTVARLAALAIVDSPRVLMQLFGHRDISMTLHYILAEKALQVEIEQVTRELRIMRCQEVIESIHMSLHESGALAFGGHGGGAVSHIAEAVRVREGELNRQDRQWSAESAHELAVMLTLNGQYFRVVKPGVLCTKPSREATPCQCGSDCINRIEEKTARRDVMELIPILIDEGQRALAEDQLMVVANTVEQLDEELARFEDIGAMWYESPEVIALRKAVET
ncbi:hypothetical protein C4K04_4775 [Pseudomonas chlororaphis]|uniref:Uncharacterized protein n=1 Tax=Pseudomonas chlororaphis TaxID=587753 RepID=A0A3G7TTR5_9PSED|nr:tyrosine-type recombinase/integrase [Pseudomonas chlororaphis]AZE50430.1 hypothetical protein C4K04_4775 [Pseudomonas chlororaphis]